MFVADQSYDGDGENDCLSTATTVVGGCVYFAIQSKTKAEAEVEARAAARRRRRRAARTTPMQSPFSAIASSNSMTFGARPLNLDLI
jgi:hypothetical protein